MPQRDPLLEESALNPMNLPHRFYLQRDEDETGVSGVGVVAWGVEFADGTCVLRWATMHRSTAIYASITDLRKIHGHEGRTKTVWLDNARGTDG